MVPSKEPFSVWRSPRFSFWVSIPPEETMMTRGSLDFLMAGRRPCVRRCVPTVLVAKFFSRPSLVTWKR